MGGEWVSMRQEKTPFMALIDHPSRKKKKSGASNELLKMFKKKYLFFYVFLY